MSSVDIAALKDEALAFGYEPATTEYREYLERRLKEERDFLREQQRLEAERNFQAQEDEKAHRRALELQEQANAHSQEMVRLSPAPVTPPPEDAQAAARRLLPPPAPYRPKEEPLDRYLQSYEKYCDLVGMSPDHKAIGLTSLLPGDLRAILDVLPTEDRQDYEKVREALLRAACYTPEFCRRRFRDVEPTEQDNTKSLLLRKSQYLDDWLKVSKVNDKQLRHFLVVDDFLRSMPVGYAAYVREGNSYDLDVVAERGDRYLDLHHAGRSIRTVQQQYRANHPRNRVPQKPPQQPFKNSQSHQSQRDDNQVSPAKPFSKDQRPIVNSHFKKDYHNKGSYQQPKDRNNFSKGFGFPAAFPPAKDPYCTYHKAYGHATDACKDKPSTSSKTLGAIQLAPVVSAAAPPMPLNPLLFPDTTWAPNPNLPQVANLPPPEPQAPEEVSSETPRRLSALSLVSQTNLQTCQGKLDGKPVSILLDSGAEGIFVDRSLVREDQYTGQEVPVLMPEGDPVKRPVCRIHLECPYYTGPYLAVAMNKPAQQVYLGPISGSKPFPGTTAALHAQKQLAIPQEPSVTSPANSQETDASSLRPAPLQAADAALHHPPEAQNTAAPFPPANLNEPAPIPFNSAQFAADQKACPTLKTWHQLAAAGPPRNQFPMSKSPQYLYIQGLLHQKTVSRGKEFTRLCVPQCHRSNIISWAHHDPHHGHQGPTQTLERLKKFYIWPYIHIEVSRYSGACLLCQANTTPCPPEPPPSHSQMPGPHRRPHHNYSQATPHGNKPWANPPHWRQGAPHAPRGSPPSIFPVPPACHPLAQRTPHRWGHPHLSPGAPWAMPASSQAPPYPRRN